MPKEPVWIPPRVLTRIFRQGKQDCEDRMRQAGESVLESGVTDDVSEGGGLPRLERHLSKMESLMGDFNSNFAVIEQESNEFSRIFPAIVDEMIRAGEISELRVLEVRMKKILGEFMRRRAETQEELLKCRRSARGISSYRMNDGHRRF